MLGVVYTSFIEMVEERFSPDVADDLLENPQLKYDGVYTSVGSYDHGDMIRMVVHLSELTDIPVDDLVKAFAEYLFAQLASRYPDVLGDRERMLDFLEVIATSVHTGAQALPQCRAAPVRVYPSRRRQPDDALRLQASVRESGAGPDRGVCQTLPAAVRH